MKRLRLHYGTFFLSCFLLFFIAVAHAQSDPVNMLQSVANQLIDKLKAHQTSLKEDPELVFSLARSTVVPHADLDEMSKRVLPPTTWNQATPEQRIQFEKAFTTLLVRTYASALADYKDQTIQFMPVRGGFQGKSTLKVSSQIMRSSGPPIAVDYQLVLKGSEWKLYDMTVEGVSLLESFRSQFADQLAEGNMSSLIKNLQDHNNSNAGNT